jgi:hypothetical protein
MAQWNDVINVIRNALSLGATSRLAIDGSDCLKTGPSRNGISFSKLARDPLSPALPGMATSPLRSLLPASLRVISHPSKIVITSLLGIFAASQLGILCVARFHAWGLEIIRTVLAKSTISFGSASDAIAGANEPWRDVSIPARFAGVVMFLAPRPRVLYQPTRFALMLRKILFISPRGFLRSMFIKALNASRSVCIAFSNVPSAAWRASEVAYKPRRPCFRECDCFHAPTLYTNAWFCV